MTKFEKCVTREEKENILMEFYEAAGFWPDVLETEIKSMSDEELIKNYSLL